MPAVRASAKGIDISRDAMIRVWVRAGRFAETMDVVVGFVASLG